MLQAPTSILSAALAKGREARVIDIEIEGESKPRTVYIKQISRRPFDHEILTVTLNEVNKTELMSADVPVVGYGTPDSVLKGYGVLVAATSTIRLTGNYSDLPATIRVDTSKLSATGNIHASDIPLPKGTTLACPPNTTLFMIQVLRGAAVTETAEPDEPTE